MKRGDSHRKIDRNTSMYEGINKHTHENTTMPNQLDQIWLPDGSYHNGVQIVELNSSDNPQSSSEDEPENLKDPWMCVAEDLLNGTNFFKANNEARERRRAQRYRNVEESMEFGELYEHGTNDMSDHVVFNHVNYFTILNNQFNAQSNSSSEHDPDSQADELNDTNNCEWDDIYLNSDVRNFDTDIDRKRTVWIYSFKNKHLLSDNDFELVNIPSIDNSSIEEITKELGVERVATPIPSSYIPRLNLSETSTLLPNVTEVTEPNKNTFSNQTGVSQVHRFNGWFQSESVTPHKENTQEQSNNVINWMSLSPRERKRKLINKSPAVKPVVYRQPLTTVVEVAYNVNQNTNPEASKNVELVKIETDAAIEKVSENEIKPVIELTETTAVASQDLDDKIDVVENDEIVEDRGDYDREHANPKIKIGSHRTKRLQITEPLENLNSDRWILEQPSKLNRGTSFNILDGLLVDDSGSASRVLHIRNSDLLKPVSWTQYLPITASVPSLNLSLTTDSIEQSSCWIFRVAKWFRCCR